MKADTAPRTAAEREAARRRYLRKRRLQDAGWIALGIFMLAAIIALVVVGLWLHFAAPCKYVDWMPTKDIPSRCLSVDVR